MTNWIPATRTTAGYYADDPPVERHYPPTCRERQDAALDELFSAVTRLASDLYALRKRVVALEAPAGVSYAILEPVRDDAIDNDDSPDPMEDV